VTKRYCVLNLTRESFLSLGVVKADTPWTRLRGLLGKRRLHPDDGLWVVPSQGIHTVGVRFAIDVVYLDSRNTVIEVVEDLRPFRVGPLRTHAASVIELPPHSVRASQTEAGDRCLICSPDEMVRYLEDRRSQVELQELRSGSLFSGRWGARSRSGAEDQL
jgi:uncharacterized membrane protein (UPF0127 family)